MRQVRANGERGLVVPQRVAACADRILAVPQATLLVNVALGLLVFSAGATGFIPIAECLVELYSSSTQSVNCLFSAGNEDKSRFLFKN